MRAPDQLPLAVDRACWQGEPVVAVVAATRAEAEDAAEATAIEWEALPALTDPIRAMQPESQAIHPQLGSNIAYQGAVTSGDIKHAFATAAVVVEREFRFGRHTGVCLEPRTIIADYTASDGTLIVYQSHQCPAQQQDIYARLLDIPEHKVRVVCPDVGGAFGIKQQLYGDELAVCVLSKILRRPIKFVADRIESFSSDIHAREHVVTARLAVAANGRFLGMEAQDCFGIGAYSQYPRSSVGEGSHVLRMSGAPYVLNAYRVQLNMVLQNKNMVGHYRSVGHPIAVAVTECLVDAAARTLGIDPIDIRQRNFIPDDSYPYKSHGGFVFDRLTQHACLEKIVGLMNWPELRADQKRMRQQGVYRGLGLASFVELTGTGPEYYGKGEVRVSAQDGCLVKLEPSGTLRCIPSVTEQGQGIDTAIGQIVAGVIGVRFEDVAVISGDTESSPYGGGAWASRGVSVGGEAAHRAAVALRDNILAVAGQVLQARADSLAIRDGIIVSLADGTEHMTLADVARLGYFRQDLLPLGMQPEFSVIRHFVPQGRQFQITNGIHGSWIEVDPDTGFIRLLRHFVVHDAGTMVNPLLVEEQIRGGVVQGLGSALFEEIVYGPDGELLTGTMADYLVPMSAEMPDIIVDHVSTPAAHTHLGAKGVGEAGMAGAPAAVLNAVNDALAAFDVQLTQLPLTPERVLRALGRIP
jgi:carbon-monoxide dehydrogenase large subunit